MFTQPVRNNQATPSFSSNYYHVSFQLKDQYHLLVATVESWCIVKCLPGVGGCRCGKDMIQGRHCCDVMVILVKIYVYQYQACQ